MEKRDRYIAAAIGIIALAVIAYFLFFPTPESDKIRVHADPAFAASVAESNEVILRMVYPFTNTAGPGSAITYATQVFIFAGKTVVIQVIEGNTCTRTSFTPTPNDKNVIEQNEMVISPSDCIAESEKIPTIEIRQAPSDSIWQSALLTKVEGTPEDIPLMVRYVILKIYPDADKVIEYTNSLLSQVTQRRQH